MVDHDAPFPSNLAITSCVGGRHNMPRPCKLTFDLLSESRVTWATTVPISVFLGLSVVDLCTMSRCTRQTDVRQTDRRQTRIIA